MFAAPRRRTVAVVSFLVVAALVLAAPGLRAGDKKECRLSFVPVDTLVRNYKVMSQTDQNYGGTDVRMNQTLEVAMAFVKKADDGNAVVRFTFTNVTSSVVQGTQLVDWEPPLKLEGGFLEGTISPKGEVVEVHASKNVQGVHSTDQLADVIEPWFIDYPDTTIAVGKSWTKHVVKGKKDEGKPDIEGDVVYTLKKIETKDGVEVAVIEGKIKLDMNRPIGIGMLVAEGEGDVKATIAVAGGYVIELKQTVDISGETVVKDDLTEKVTKQETAATQYVECKLQH